MSKVNLAIILVLAFITPLLGDDYNPFTSNEGSLTQTSNEGSLTQTSNEGSLTQANAKEIISNDALEDGATIPEIQFTNNEITMIFQIISDATGWSIFPSNAVSKTTISLWAKNISAKELLEKTVLLSGFVYHYENGIIKVITYDEYMEYCGVGKSVINLDYATADSVVSVLKEFLTQHGKIVVHEATNTIVLYEIEKNMEFLDKILEQLDVPSLNHIVEVIEINYANPASTYGFLSEIFNKDVSKGKTGPNKAQSKDSSVEPDDTVMALPNETVLIYFAENTNRIVVSGTQKDVEQVKRLLKKIDLPSETTQIEIVSLEFADAEVLAGTLTEIFLPEDEAEEVLKTQSASKNTGQTSLGGALMSSEFPVTFIPVGRTNRLIVKCYKQDIATVLELIERLDVYTESTTQNYHLVYIEAEDIYEGLENTLGGGNNRYGGGNNRSRSRNGYNGGSRYGGGSQSNNSSRSVSLTLLETSNSILLSGPPSGHRILKSILKNIDIPMPYDSGVIRVYELDNADAGEVAATINELIASEDEDSKLNNKQAVFKDPDADSTPNADIGTSGAFVQKVDAKVSTNTAINAVIIQATAQKHQEFAKLIEKLDERREQVLIEAMIVEVVTKENAALGIELSHVRGDQLAFTAFGLSTIDTATGALNVIASPGGTAAILTPDKIQGLIKALQSNDKVRVECTPKVLVNDNAVGFLESLQQEPISTFSQGQNSDQLSFGGYEDAGTTFEITPHISESGYLRIEYSITLASFGEQAQPQLPPSRSKSNIKSEVTVPNGNTIIVGGLQTTVENESVDKIPLLGDLPIIGAAFKNSVTSKSHLTTYLFITPTIMKDEEFDDLKEASGNSMDEIEKIRKYENVLDE